jgi:hypothetical protein
MQNERNPHAQISRRKKKRNYLIIKEKIHKPTTPGLHNLKSKKEKNEKYEQETA